MIKAGQCLFRKNTMVIIDRKVCENPDRFSITYVQKEFPFQSGGGSFSWGEEDFRLPETLEEKIRCRRVELQLEIAIAEKTLKSLKSEMVKINFPFEKFNNEEVQK